jgi:drug/metabolite transporter (DMT)-like permease
MAVMTLWIMITGCLWLVLFTLGSMPAITWTKVPLSAWLGIAYLAVFTTIITFFISQWATLHLGPTRVMAYSFLYPPLIVLIEWFLYHNLPALQTLFGIVIILPAMVIVQKNTNPP